MRPVTPLVFTKIKPADLSKQPGPDFDIVPPTSLCVDDAYQRGLNDKSMAAIKRMVENWSWAKFKPPICVKVGDQLHVIDGQHTSIAAATHGGIPVIPVVVVAAPHLTDRADAFVSHATAGLAATPTQVWHAALAAGDKDALRVQRIINAVGMTLAPYPKPPAAYKVGETIALKTIRGIILKRGDKLAKDVLRATVLAGVTPILSDHMKISDALLCEEDYAGEFDVERVASSLGAVDPKVRVDAEQLAAAKDMPLWKALAAMLYRNRNAKPKPTPAPVEPAPKPAPTPAAFKSVLPEARQTIPFHEPEPGRSALDERRRARA